MSGPARTILHPSPVGPLTLECDGGALIRVAFQGEAAPLDGTVTPPGAELERSPGREVEAVLDAARRQLDEYFSGRRTCFELPLEPRGTEFQRRVWAALLEIPHGRTVSYGHVAARVGSRAAVRAVGGAVGANPLAILIPCHRVVGANGALTGFGGGLGRKRLLLELERGELLLIQVPGRAFHL